MWTFLFSRLKDIPYRNLLLMSNYLFVGDNIVLCLQSSSKEGVDLRRINAFFVEVIGLTGSM